MICEITVHLLVIVQNKKIQNNTRPKLWKKSKTFYFQYSFSENRAVYEIMWENMVQRGRPQMTVWRMRVTHWITNATDTHSEYVILIAFLQQQWLRERASLLRYTYIACLVRVSCCHQYTRIRPTSGWCSV